MVYNGAMPALSEKWVTHTGYTIMETGQNVYEAALDRIRSFYGMVDTVVVSFSGGKDSTAVLQVALEVARYMDRLPLVVQMFDVEIFDPDTVEYALDVASWPEVDFYWYCIPTLHEMKSRSRTHWTSWDPEYKSLWVRQPPEFAIMELPGFTAGGISKAASLTFQGSEFGEVGQLAGIRVEEGFNRRRVLMNKGSWLFPKPTYLYGKPIYDWTVKDVWQAILTNNWPYSDFYKKMRRRGVAWTNQRVAPWGNTNSARETQYWPELYPEYYDKVLRRLPELRAQARYGDTKIFREVMNKPAGLTWQDWALKLLSQQPEETQEHFIKMIRSLLLRWKRFNTVPFPDDDTIVDGKKNSLQSWKRIAMVVSKGSKHGRNAT